MIPAEWAPDTRAASRAAPARTENALSVRAYSSTRLRNLRYSIGQEIGGLRFAATPARYRPEEL
jgi:hypothetical protein